MIELSKYAFERLRADGEFVLYRARRSNERSCLVAAKEEPSSILVLAPALERPELGTLERLRHEHSLRDELDQEWAIRPIELARYWDRSVLILEDPGGVPLDQLLGNERSLRSESLGNVASSPNGGQRLDGLLGQPMELDRFLPLAINLAAALGKLHRRGLIHKDIKPAHIVIESSTNKVWFTGFGTTSRLLRERQAAELPETIEATLAYMSPEQTGRMNRSIDSRSDLYSLGITFYQMVTGAVPFTASDPLGWVHCHIARQPATPGERVPKPVCAIIMKLLAKTAEERYQTAAGVEHDLRRCLDEYLRSSGIKGVQEKISEFPLGERDTPDRLVIPEKLYGREREIETLHAAFERVVRSGRPELVLVSGYSGIGKSSVVNELHRLLVSPRGLFAAGKFDQYKRDIPYSTLAQAFQNLIRPLLAKSEAELSKWRDALGEALGSSGQLIIDLVPELKFIIGEQPPMTHLPPLDAQRRFQLVFRRFINVFAQKEHVLALFLDDLQWLDAATLDFLEDVLLQPDVHHLLLIGAYRDNEVGATHPLAHKLDAIRQSGARIQEIHLAPLTRQDLGQLIAESIRGAPEDAKPLARLAHEKTGGNPFFAIQFISTLAEESLLSFDHDHGRWSWDLDRIHAKGYTENVVALLIGKLQRLPVETRDALQQFACLGSTADAETLSLVLGRPRKEVQAQLWPALHQELVVPLNSPAQPTQAENAESSVHAALVRSRSFPLAYKFVHDRILEAAYSLIPEESRAQAHLGIGRLLLANTAPERRGELAFEIANQFKPGHALILDPDEKVRVAQLNLEAGRKAKRSTAYSSACAYLSAGMELIGSDVWKSQYELALDLWLERAECEYLNGEFDKSEELIAELLIRVHSKVDKALAYRLRILLQTMRAQYVQAVNTGTECLRLFGINLSAHPARNQVEAEYKRVWTNLGNRSIESLIDLPPMTNPQKQAAIEVLSDAAGGIVF